MTHTSQPHRPSVTDNAGTSKQSVVFFLIGDLFQLATQEQFLLDNGFSVGRTDIYPGLYTLGEFQKALNVIWGNKLSGWDLYKAEFLRHSICTEPEFVLARQKLS